VIFNNGTVAISLAGTIAASMHSNVARSMGPPDKAVGNGQTAAQPREVDDLAGTQNSGLRKNCKTAVTRCMAPSGDRGSGTRPRDGYRHDRENG
jgi:hypothetical protein